MEANIRKCYFLITSGSQSELKTGNEHSKSGTCEKLLGIKIKNKLRLNTHVENSSQSHFTYGNSKVTYSVMNAFFRSQFSYCPLVWMCHSRTLNNEINRLHEGCLRTVYNNKL